MKDQELERYRETLIEMRDRTREEIGRMMEVVAEDAQPLGEHDRKTSESIDKEVVLENTEETIRNAVNAALQRMDEGTFGVCQDCGKQIPKARLDALPYAEFCVACEREYESS